MIPEAFCLFAYLIGSLSSAIITCKLFKLPDPRSGGSGNPGATNVLRLGGKLPALITLAGDVLKGIIPVALAMSFRIETIWLGLIALCACLGHSYPVFFRFRGGKGVATAFGVIHLLNWKIALALDLIWLITAFLSRISSLAALTAWLCAPLLCYQFAPQLLPGIALLSLLIFVRHQGNLVRLFKGTESRF